MWFLLPLVRGQQDHRSVSLGVIVLSSEKEATQILERLRNGEDFGALARQYSTDPTANQSGYIGPSDPGTLRPELQQAIKGMMPGQISGVIKISAAYVIIKFLDDRSGRMPPAGPPGRLQALAAEGAMRLTADFSGYSEAVLLFNRFRKPSGWQYDLRAACAARVQSVGAAIAETQGYLSRPIEDPRLSRTLNTVLAHLYAYRGDMDSAIRYWTAAYQIALRSDLAQAAVLEEALGVGYLHKAGHTVYDRFVFPFPAPANSLTSQEKADLSNAIGYFLRYLKRQPESVEVKWLLNLSFLLSGEYPQGVPSPWLIPFESLRMKADSVRFTDVTAAAGLDRYGSAGGLIVDDFDNDGFLDVMVSDLDDCSPIRYFHNDGDGRFTDRTVQAGLSDQTGGLNIIQTDYNNDGCRDVLILRGGWEYPRRRSLLKNNCNGTFTDVTVASGLLSIPTSTQTAVWTDIDNDGNLDLFLGNENAPAQLFLNKGDGTFVDISHASGIDREGFVKAVVAADYDHDGYPDLFVSNFSGQSFLYHNKHDRTFQEVSRRAGIEPNGRTFGAWFFDYDNDGWPDLFSAGYYASVEDVMFGYLGIPQEGRSLRLYRNLGNGKFWDVTSEVGLDRAFLPMGLNFGDIDNDGYLDFYLGSGSPTYAAVLPNVLFRNQDGKRFVDVTVASGTGILPKGHGIAFADLNNDGQEDLYVVMGGATPGDRHMSRLFANPGTGNDWIGIHLVGVKSNRAAIGAQISIRVRNAASGVRTICRTVGSGGSFGASPLESHIGLGKAATIENIEIWWPASDSRQNFAAPVNQVIEIREFGKKFRTVPRRSFSFGAGGHTASAIAIR